VSINKAFSHDCIILDACCIINLYASQQMRAILGSIPKTISVATYVKDYEVLSIYSGPIENVQDEHELIDLQPFIEEKLLFLADIETDFEANTYINFAQKLDDGEAITGAIAINRNWAIATDDAKSIKMFQSNASQIAIVSTLDLVKYWADTEKPNNDIILNALLNIRVRGKYAPHRDHPLAKWWQKFM